jgi:two-component system, chemotaxis family, sensor histidine kinase and response regulator WspE
MADSFLLDLFREEVRAHSQVLNEGLVALERTSPDAKQIEPLMRAAHSIKGAARVVAVEPAVRVAHVLEDCLVKVQKGELKLSSAAIDVLLRGVDTLTQIAVVAGPDFAAWEKANATLVAELLVELEAVALGRAIAAPVAEVKAEPTPEVPVPVVVVPEAPSAPPATTVTQASSAEAEERVVRVTAQSLTRLMGLAGESLVEARWLQPFASSLLRLKRLQGRVHDDLSELGQTLPTDDASERSRALLADACQRLDECHQLLVERIEEFETHARQSDDLNSRLYHEVIVSRMRPFRDGVQGYPRLVRDLSRQLGKSVQFEVRGEATNVDRDILDKLDAPLNHILRNAIDHAMESPAERKAAGKPETGRLVVEARHSAGMLSISVIDDGRGIDLEKLRVKVVERKLTSREMAANLTEAELLEFLFLPGFSTAERVTDVSGRGVGLDVVHSTVHEVGGSVRIQTRLGRGTTFHLQLPITLSVIRAVLVQIAGEPYAFPHHRIDRLIRLPRADLQSLEHRQYFEVDGRNVGIILGRQILGLDGDETVSDELVVVLFSNQTQQYGLVVDGFHGEQDLVVRPLDPRLGKVPNISAAAILEDGSPVLIVDLDDLRRSIEKLLHGGRLRRADSPAEQARQIRRKRVLVVDDSITVREVERQLLANRGYEVEVAVDGEDGWNAVRAGKFDLVVSDVDMPRLNGIDFVRRIKADPRLQATPVVIVSYKDREEDRLRGLDAGANYYLTKSSFHDETLVQVVQELIGDSEA